MARRRALITGVALVAAHVAVVIVVAFLLWWPSLLQALQGMHGPFGGSPGMHR